MGGRCPQTCWDRAACLLFPGPSLVGRTQKYCVTQPKHSFLRLPLFMKRKSNPGIHALLASSQVLKCHFWGDALPRAGCSLQGNENPSPSSPAHLWWWASSSLPLLPPPPPPSPLGGPVRPELGCWVSVPALGGAGAGAGAFQPREPPKRSFAIACGLVHSPLFALGT